MKRRFRFFAILFAGLLGIWGVGHTGLQEPPSWQWSVSTPDEQGLDPKRLAELTDLIRDVLEKTHQEGGSLTVYSNINDLKKGMICIYNLRNFEEVVVLNLAWELKKGQRRRELGSLFKSRAQG